MSDSPSAPADLAAPSPAIRPRIDAAFWTLSDQVTVSIGAFLANIGLARHLPTAEYGTYGLLLNGIFMLQMTLFALVFHPLSIRKSLACPETRSHLVLPSLAIAGILCIPLGAILCLGLALGHRSDLIPPALALFLAWQLQETLRRNLLSEQRFRAATVGDAAAYLGQVAFLIALATTGQLTLPAFLWGATMLFLAAATIQLIQLAPKIDGPLGLNAMARDFWASGGWSLFSNALSALRLQSAPWILGWLHGAGTVALLQASGNIVNLVNPVLMALCNVIPPATARANRQGPAPAWRAARFYILAGSPLLVLACGVMLAVPDLLLRIVYGAGSLYSGLGDQVRILAFAAGLGFATEMICAYFHGIDRARQAFTTNAAGTLACVVFLPLIWSRGLTGACMAIMAVQLVRFVSAHILLMRTLSSHVERTE